VYDTWASIPWVHRTVLHREGSGNREDRAMREGGVEMNETKQENDARQASKHDQVHRAGLGWGSGWPLACNQSPTKALFGCACIHLNPHVLELIEVELN
jgi:hypothetical protein